MRFPVLDKKPMAYPLKSTCPHCGKKSNHSFAVLGGGALLMDRKKKSGSMDDRLNGFLHVTWHGDHSGNSKNPCADIHAHITIAEDTPMGQFEFYFCSTKCLRSFLNTIVDALEMKMDKRKKEIA